MTRLIDQLSDLTIEATSPDGCIKARCRGGRPQALGFRPGTYSGYTEDAIATQLASLARLLYVEHERTKRRITTETGVHETTDPAQARDQPEAQFLRGLRTITVVGVSDNNLVRFKIDGIAQWRCRVAAGTLSQLPESVFATEAINAAHDLLRKNTLAKAVLKNKHFGSGIINEKALDDALTGHGATVQ